MISIKHGITNLTNSNLIQFKFSSNSIVIEMFVEMTDNIT